MTETSTLEGMRKLEALYRKRVAKLYQQHLELEELNSARAEELLGVIADLEFMRLRLCGMIARTEAVDAQGSTPPGMAEATPAA